MSNVNNNSNQLNIPNVEGDISENTNESNNRDVIDLNNTIEAQPTSQTEIIDLLSSSEDSDANNSNNNQESDSNSAILSSDSSWIPSEDELSIMNDNINNDNDDNTTENEMDVDDDWFAFKWRYIEGQQSNIIKNGELWFKNDNYFCIFGHNIKSKFDLFRYNIFIKNSKTITTRQDDQNFVTKYIWPKLEYRMRFEDYQNHDFIHSFFINLLQENKMNILYIIHDKEFIISGNPVIDSGGVSQEAINIFSNNFMKKLHQIYPNFITHHSEMFCTFINTMSNVTRDVAMETFVLGSIFILMFTGRCPSLADPTLCASIFNYSEILPIEFYEKYPNLCTFLDNPMFQTYIRSLENNETFNLIDFSNNDEESLPKMLHNFCEQFEIDYNIATYHLQNGSFFTMCKEKYCNESVTIGSYIVDNILETVFDNLSIKPYEFCQMVNYDTDVKDYYWAHYMKVNSLDQFLNYLKTECANKIQRQIIKLEQSFGPINLIQDFSLIRDRVMNNSEYHESKKAKLCTIVDFPN